MDAQTILAQLAGESSDDLEGYAVRAVTIDQHDLAGEYARVPADLAYWGVLAAESEAAYQRAKDELRRLEGEATLAAQASSFGGKSPNADRVKALVEQMPQVQDARRAVTRADAVRRRHRAIVDAISAKLQSLVSLGAQLRRELDSTRYAT